MRRSACDHCGLPVRGERTDTAGRRFCCYGCALAFRIWGGGESPEESLAGGVLGRLMLAILFAMASMVFSIALYASAVFPPPDGAEHALGPLAPVFQWLAIIFALPVFVLLGWPLLSQNVQSFEAQGAIGPVNALILVGVGAALVLSVVNAWRGSGEVFVETAVLVLVLVTLGRFLDAQARQRVTRSLRGFFELDAGRTLRIEPGGEEGAPVEVAIDRLRPGDLVRVRAGERIAADGVVTAGSGAVDRSVTSGEAFAEALCAGARVYAGGVLLDGSLDVRVTAAIGDRLIDRMAEMAEDARFARMPLERLSERLARWFLPLSIVLALATAVYWVERASAGEAVLNALAVLLIACPCAIGIATPLATWVAIGRAARRGVLVRRAEVFETLARGARFFLDKTGTMTSGSLRLREVLVAPGGSREELERVAALLAARSAHPVARAVAESLAGRAAARGEVGDVRVEPGRGLRAEVDGARTVLGSRALVEAELAAGEGQAERARFLRAVPCDATQAFVARGGVVLGAFIFEERLRPEARATIEALAARGLPIAILSGDTAGRAEQIARELGVPAHGGLLPAEKAERLRCARAAGGLPVVLVGDGFNDAPGMPVADVGIALASGADLTRENADVVLLEESGRPLSGLLVLLDLARETLRRVRFNLFWAFLYNACGMALAAAGKIHPLVAASLMIASSLFVIFGSVAGAGAGAAPAARLAKRRDAVAPAEDVSPCPVTVEPEEHAGAATL